MVKIRSLGTPSSLSTAIPLVRPWVYLAVDKGEKNTLGSQGLIPALSELPCFPGQLTLRPLGYLPQGTHQATGLSSGF